MGIEKLWTKSRADRLLDPDIQTGINEERMRLRESLGRLGNQTKESCTAIVYNTLVRPVASTLKSDKSESAPAKEIVSGAVDSTAKVGALVGRVLLATGRAAKYGVRRAFVI